MSTKIIGVHGREILDSRGNPTVEADVRLEGGIVGRAAVPSGASTGEHEAIELRDGDKSRYLGKGVQKAVAHVNAEIAKVVAGLDASDQQALDRRMIEADGTPNKSKFGANAILAVSMAAARAAASSAGRPLYKYLSKYSSDASASILPVPMMNILNGGAHADNSVDVQEFMVMPLGAPNFREALRWGVEVFHHLKAVLKKNGYSTAVGDEGGFAPNLKSNEEALERVLEAITAAGFKPGEQISIALDPAASEFYDRASKKYVFKKSDKSARTSAQMVEFWNNWIRQVSHRVPRRRHVRGRLGRLETPHAANRAPKSNSLATMSSSPTRKSSRAAFPKALPTPFSSSSIKSAPSRETIEAVEMARKAKYAAIISHRSGETEDAFIADFAVAMGAGQIKTGSASRTDRIAKYNQLLRIEEELGSSARFLGRSALARH